MPGHSGRILLVDDEPSLLKMMEKYLRRMGHEVTTAGTTQQALTEVSSAPQSFDGAVLDATMDGMRMEDLALRILQGNPHVFVIAASGYPIDMSAIEAAAPGRVIFLHKPFTPETLAGTVRRMLDAQEKGI